VPSSAGSAEIREIISLFLRHTQGRQWEYDMCTNIDAL
jgi:hypothetical protein